MAATKTQKTSNEDKKPAKASKSNTSPKPSSKKSDTKPSHKEDLEKIFKDCLKDIYWAEKNLAKALPQMAKASFTEALANAFNTHTEQTRTQIAKLEAVFGMLEMKPVAKKCDAMEGLLKEGKGQIEEYQKGPARDAALIVAAQKVEHYEISAYGSLRTFAEVLGENKCAQLFEEIHDEELATDDLLTKLAKKINQEAAKM